MTAAAALIDLEHASRWYGQVIGVNDVTGKVAGGITALLGPNGAGKSTLLKLVTGQLRPTTGTVKVFGETPFANPRVFRRLGYVPEIESNYDDMTGRDFVTLLAAIGGMPATTRADRVTEVIEQVGMTHAADRRIGGYSKGMRQRIKLAQSIVHDPDLLVLDEPLNGLDPMGRRDISNLLRSLADQGKGILISSHILHEVEQLTHNILLIHHGRVLAQGDIYLIRGLMDKHPHRIAITTTQPRDVARHLLALPHVVSIRFDEARAGWMEIETRSAETFYDELPELVLQYGFVVTGFDSPDNNLESVFKYLVSG